MTRSRSEQGSALIATFIISLLLLSVLVWHLSQARLIASFQTHEYASEYALQYAESALLMAEQRLQFPGVLSSSGTLSGAFEMPHGRGMYELVRSSAAAHEEEGNAALRPVIVEVWATGYYELEKGPAIDPVSGRAADKAVLGAKIKVSPLATFPLASPGKLELNALTTVLFGPVYARHVNFRSEPPRPEEAHNILEGILFGERMSGPATPSLAAPKPVEAFPHFPVPAGKLRAYYRSLAASDKNRLADGATLEGRTPPPENSQSPVYYCHGDLHLGSSSVFEPTAPMIVYVEGNLIIHRSIAGSGNSWAAFLVEKDIRLAPEGPAKTLQLRGNFITNGALRWHDSIEDPKGISLNLAGNLLCARGFDHRLNGVALYVLRWQLDEAILPLPRFTQRLETRLLVGRYRH